MSQEYAWPSSSDLEIDARRLHAPCGASDDDQALARALGGLPQSFDLAAVAICAVLVFPQTVFTSLWPPAAIATGLLVWSLAPWVSRVPIPLFDLIRRRHGHGVRVTAARVMLGGATAAIAFLPDASRAGAAACLLLVGCRVLQGFAVRGLDFSAADTRLDGSAAVSRSAWFSWSRLGGMLTAGLLMGVLYLTLDRADFLQWGWRYPFLVSIAGNIAALFADLRLLATPGRDASETSGVRLVTIGGVRVDRSHT